MNLSTFQLTVTATSSTCPVGEKTAQACATEGAIPVLSCEGPCIRGEVARLAAHRLARQPGFARACHGELLTAPDSAMARWVKGADSVVVIDGCHMRCQGRMLDHLVPPDRIRGFNAQSQHRRYSELFDYDAVPEPERNAVASGVASWVQAQLRADAPPASTAATCGCSAPGGSTCASPAEATPAPSSDQPASSAQPPAADPSSVFCPEVAALVAIAAAVGANCEPCLRHHVREAEQIGVSHADIDRAVAVAARVKETPARNILALAQRLTAAANPAEGGGGSCCQ